MSDYKQHYKDIKNEKYVTTGRFPVAGRKYRITNACMRDGFWEELVSKGWKFEVSDKTTDGSIIRSLSNGVAGSLVKNFSSDQEFFDEYKYISSVICSTCRSQWSCGKLY